MAERRFMALAKPSGFEDLGIAGPHVLLVEHSGSAIRRRLPFTEAEAIALRDALNGAIRALAHGRAISAQGGAPAAYQGPWPIRSHRTLAEVSEG